MFVDAVGHKELRVLGPAVTALGKPNLVVSEWLAMSRGRVLLVRGAVADVTIEHNESGPFLGFAEDVEGILNAFDVVGVTDAQDVSTVNQKPSCNIISDSDACIAVDDDVDYVLVQ